MYGIFTSIWLECMVNVGKCRLMFHTWNDWVINIPGTQMTSIFEGQPPKTSPFPTKTRVIWVPGSHIYIFQFIFTDAIHARCIYSSTCDSCLVWVVKTWQKPNWTKPTKTSWSALNLFWPLETWLGEKALAKIAVRQSQEPNYSCHELL